MRNCIVCQNEIRPHINLSRHHVDYIKNVYVEVCPDCHKKLHTSLLNHRFGGNNVRWKCHKCNKIVKGLICKCGLHVAPGHNGTIHREQRQIKRRK